MLHKLLFSLILCSSFSFSMSASMLEKASKNQLGCIKGLGVKRVEAIVSYRKSHKINILEDLLSIKGIGKGIVANIKVDKKKKVCTSFSPKIKTNKKKKIGAK